MYNPFGKVSGPRPKHSGAKPLPDNKDVWASEDWDDVKKRKLAAILHEATQGGDKSQVLVDAIYQASSTSYFVPDRLLKRIEDAMSFDFEQRPHAPISESPIGQPVEHLKLLAELKKLRASVYRLKIEAASKQLSFMTVETTTRVLQARLEEIKANERELSRKYAGACSCKVCGGITSHLGAIGKALGDRTLRQSAPRRPAPLAASTAPRLPALAAPQETHAPAQQTSTPLRRQRPSLRSPTADHFEKLAMAVELVGQGVREICAHMPQFASTLDRIAHHCPRPPLRPSDSTEAGSFPIGNPRAGDGAQYERRADKAQDRLKVVRMKRELAGKEKLVARCREKIRTGPLGEREILLDILAEECESMGELRQRILGLTVTHRTFPSQTHDL